MKLLYMLLFIGFFAAHSPALAALPLPDGMTPASVKTDMDAACAADAQSAACRRFSLLNYCRGNYNQAKCTKERQHYWCNEEPESARCDRLTAQIGSGSSSGGSGDDDGDEDIDDQDTDPVDNGDNEGSIPLCYLMGTCTGSSSSGASGSSGSTSSSSGSGSSTSSSSSGSTSSSTSGSSSSSSGGDVDNGLVQGAFMGGNSVYKMLEASKATLFIDSGNPISTSSMVRSWIFKAQGGQSMSLPRPANVRLAFAGYVPKLRDFSYTQAANNDARWHAEWVAIGEALQSSGYGNTIIYSSETEKAWKKWHPTPADIAGGENSNWKRAWRNMVDAVRSKAPNAEFAFTPFTGSGSGPDGLVRDDGQGNNDMNAWYVGGTDRLGKPYMNYWGFTLYMNTQGTKCNWPCTPTLATFAENLAFKMNPNRNWSVGQQIAFARSKGLKLFNSELGLALNRGPDKKAMAGDYPEAIDTLKRFVEMTKNDVFAYVWFNGNPDFDSRIDGSSPIGRRASQRVKEIFSY